MNTSQVYQHTTLLEILMNLHHNILEHLKTIYNFVLIVNIVVMNRFL